MKPVVFILFIMLAVSSRASEIPWIHDPSTIVASHGEYWLFCTGNGVLSRHSKDLEHWEAGPPVFTNVPTWTALAVPQNRGYLWAPDILVRSNRYLLYYSVSSWGSRVSAIGLATNATLNVRDPSCHWQDQGVVIQTSEQNDFNAIDPAAFADTDGRLWLVFGSFWSGIKLVELNPSTGLRLSSDSKVYSLAYNSSIEAASLWKHGEYYYLFVNWGQCCRGVDSTYEIRVGRSRTVTGPYVDQKEIDLLYEGGTPFLATKGTVIGPGHASVFLKQGEEWLSFHFYDGNRQGKPTLGLAPLQWSTNDWPVVHFSRTNQTVTATP